MARARGSQIYSPDIVEELKNAMAMESQPGQDVEGTFRQKMNALQRFLNHGISRFSIDSWHHALTALFHAYHPHPPYNDHDNGDKPILTKLSGLGDLRALSRDVMLQREGGVLREVDAQALKYLENFLVALHCVREAKGCVADLHRFLYRYYYDPSPGREASQLHSGKAMSRASTMHVPGGPAGPSAYKASAKQFGILTLQQMSGSTDHKLRRTVGDMQEILARWDRLMTEGEIQQEDLDAESHQDLQMLSGTAVFEPVLRLMPDIFAKFYKCLELLKQWWVLAHEIYPELPINRPPTPSEEDSEGTISRLETDSELSVLNDTSLDQAAEDQVPISEQVQKIEDSIQVKEDKLQSLNNELKLLEERERYFESLVEAYEKVTAELEEQRRQRKDLVTVREKETFPSQNQMPDGGATEILSASKPHANAEDLNEQVARAESEIQMLQFQQALLRQDYMVQLEVRPSLIRFAEDLRLKIAEAQNSLVEDKMERIKLQTMAGEETVLTNARSVSPSVSDPNPNREDTPPQANTDAIKAAERKQELIRLLNKPMREDTSSSSVTGQPVTAVAAERRRRLSYPAARKEEADKTPVLAIKIHPASQGKLTTSVSNSQPLRKSPREPAVSPASNAKSPQPQRKTSDTDSQQGTEPLFHRRVRKHQGSEASNEKTSERLSNPSDQPLRKPRAKSDSHASRTNTNSLKVIPESSRRLKPIDQEKPEEKPLPKARDSKSSPRSQASSEESKHDSQTMSKKGNPSSHLRKTSTTKSPDDVGKSAMTSHSPKSDDNKDSEKDDIKRSKEATKHISATSHGSKAADVKKHADLKSSNPKPDSEKKDREKPFPKFTTRDADKSPRGTKPNPQEKDEERKRHTVSQKPIEKTPIKTTSQKSTQDDVKKDFNKTTSPDTKQDDKKANRIRAPDLQKQGTNDDKGDVTSNHKVGDVKEGGKVTSQKPHSTRRPNGVIAKK